MLLWTLGYIYLFKLVFLFSSAVYPRSGIARSYGSLFLVFWGKCILFSIMAAPVYISINSVQVFPFVHILPYICYLCVCVCVIFFCQILVPWSGIEPAPPAVEAWSLNHWTAREVPVICGLFDDSHSDRCEVISHCGFDLNIPGD